jgi:hypothetical protein
MGMEYIVAGKPLRSFSQAFGHLMMDRQTMD